MFGYPNRGLPPPDPCWISTFGHLKTNQGATAPCTPTLGGRMTTCKKIRGLPPPATPAQGCKMVMSEIWCVGKMVKSEIWYFNAMSEKWSSEMLLLKILLSEKSRGTFLANYKQRRSGFTSIS